MPAFLAFIHCTAPRILLPAGPPRAGEHRYARQGLHQRSANVSLWGPCGPSGGLTSRRRDDAVVEATACFWRGNLGLARRRVGYRGWLLGSRVGAVAVAVAVASYGSERPSRPPISNLSPFVPPPPTRSLGLGKAARKGVVPGTAWQILAKWACPGRRRDPDGPGNGSPSLGNTAPSHIRLILKCPLYNMPGSSRLRGSFSKEYFRPQEIIPFSVS